ncbi:unnamed protein product [Cylicocyclus nassatus]|uniref:DUF5641 domain-containing protein n=1 Tax=Cylicocyclus nassatus TaxID=53992 RepID=A0AA36MHE4_CYLNA|nr:unnamed protein product [Cylicocyclus nassatus]
MKAFLQIQLPFEHRDATYLWMKDTSKPPNDSDIRYYRFCRVPFDAGPAILNQALFKHLESFTSNTFREISDTLYVDNVLKERTTKNKSITRSQRMIVLTNIKVWGCTGSDDDQLEENVADHATRGLSQAEASDHVWFKGPRWLNEQEQHWPVRQTEQQSQEEEEDSLAMIATMVTPLNTLTRQPRTWPTEADKWKTEYLLELCELHVLYGNNYKSSRNNPCVGDLVLIDDDLKTSRDHWPMGMIEDLVKSKDGEIRSAVLETGTGRCVQRPLNRLISLEIRAIMDPSAMASTSRDNEEPQSSIQALPQRKPLERMAKKPINYNENVVLAKRRPWNALSILLALTTCAFVHSAQEQVLNCTYTGLILNLSSIPDLNSRSEVCVNRIQCQSIHTDQQSIQSYLPPHQLTNPYSVKWRAIMNITLYEEEVMSQSNQCAIPYIAPSSIWQPTLFSENNHRNDSYGHLHR